jgi:hypothetical protein
VTHPAIELYFAGSNARLPADCSDEELGFVRGRTARRPARPGP